MNMSSESEIPQLTWQGKANSTSAYVETGATSLPFQIVESINIPRSKDNYNEPEWQPTLFDIWQGKEGDTYEVGWKNKIIWGDSELVIPSLVERYSGKIKLVYIDPPFKKGERFDFVPTLGDSGEKLPRKTRSVIEEMKYRETWGKDLSSFLTKMYFQLTTVKELLTPDGTVWVHVDDEAGHYVKIILDEIFGRSNFINQIIWHYPDRIQGNVNRYPDNHNMILVYGTREGIAIERAKEERPKPVKQDIRGWDKEAGAIRAKRDDQGNILYRESTHKAVDNVWSFIREQHVWEIGISGATQPRNKEYWGFPTQKPLALLRRIIESASEEGDLVADFHSGSGTTAVAANQLNRRWIVGDISRWAIHLARKRILEEQTENPCEILNLGKYERKYWQVSSFGSSDPSDTKTLIFQYLAFILNLYKAEPLPGLRHIHGKKGKALIHIGAVDAPITIDEALESLEECQELNQKELHILGWEWEMGLPGLMEEEASRRGIDLSMRIIPIELIDGMPDKDILFFELGHIDVDINQRDQSNLEWKVELSEFSISQSGTDWPENLSHWSDLVDYWAIDWDYQSDTFNSQWVSYRTPKHRQLDLSSSLYRYDKPGTYKIMVKVVDIFGNDTSAIYEIETEKS